MVPRNSNNSITLSVVVPVAAAHLLILAGDGESLSDGRRGETLVQQVRLTVLIRAIRKPEHMGTIHIHPRGEESVGQQPNTGPTTHGGGGKGRGRDTTPSHISDRSPTDHLQIINRSFPQFMI